MTSNLFLLLFISWVFVNVQAIMMAVFISLCNEEMKGLKYGKRLVIAFFWPITIFYFLYKDITRKESSSNE